MIGWAIETMIATSLLILLVLVIRRPFARLFGARAAYALWLVPAFRMIVPPLPESAQIIAPASIGSVNYMLIPQTGGTPLTPDFTALAVLAWLSGAIVFLAVQCRRHRLFVASALEGARPLDAPDCPYRVLASPNVDGPMTTGLFNPVILVPDDFQLRLTPEQQRLALLHEELHHRRGDLWASAVAMIVNAVHWFNPIAHFACQALRRDMEAACDAQLLQETGHASAANYADTIVRCTSGPVPQAICALTSLDELKRRLTMLKINEGPTRRTIGFLAAGLVAFAAAATASTGPDEQVEEVHEIKKVEIHHSGKDGAKHADKAKMHKMSCAGEKFEVASEGGSGDNVEKFKFVLCADKGESLLPALEKAAAKIEKGDMPAARKAEVLTKIRAKIAELRSRG